MTHITEKTIIEQTENKPCENEGTENTYQNKERLFTQKELEEILSERLKRERKTTKALTDVKKLLKAAVDRGLVEGNSYSEMAESFCKKLGSTKEDLPENTPKEEESFSDMENSDESLLEEGALAADEAETPGKALEVPENQSATGNFNEAKEFAVTLGALREKFPDEDMGLLLSTGLFESFAKGRQGKLVDVFSDFCEFMSHLPKTKHSVPAYYGKEDEAYDDYENGLFSTAFSSDSSAATSYEDGLTKQQMDIAKSAGMSYREYAQLLDSIPKNKTRKSYAN